MKRWLFPTILGALVLALGFLFARAVKTAAAARRAADAQMAMAAQLAAATADPEATGEVKPTAENVAKPEPSADTVSAAADNAATPLGNSAEASKPRQELQSPRAKSTLNEKPAEVVVFHVQHCDAGSLADVLQRLSPHAAGNISVDRKENTLILVRPEPEYLEILKKLDQPAANKSAAASSGANEGPSQIKAFPIKNHDADELLRALRAVWPAEVANNLVIAADSRTNTLIVRASSEKLEAVEAIILLLDNMAARTRPIPANSEAGEAATLEATARVSRNGPGPMVSYGPGEQAAGEYRQFEERSMALAGEYRQQQAVAPDDSKKLEQVKSELHNAVRATFDARQAWQRSHAAQLRQRLEQIERRISERGQLSDQIIERRVEELLHPEKQWESSDGRGGDSNVAATPESASTESGPANHAPTGAPGPGPGKATLERNCWETLGLKLDKVGASEVGSLATRYHGGMRVVDIRPNGVAANSGIKRGDILVGLHTWETIRWEDINYILNQTNLINGNAPLKFYVIRGQEVLYGNLKFASGSAPEAASAGRNDLADRVQPDPLINSARRFLAENAADPRKELLSAEAAVASAQVAVAEAKAEYERSELDLKRTQALSEKGAVSERTLRGAQADVERSKAALTRAESELGIKHRLLEAARESLALEIKLREADLADAKLRMEHAAAELARAETLFNQNSIEQRVYEAKKLPQQLAASQYERAKMLLDLYRKALPDQVSFVDKTAAEHGLNDATTVAPKGRAEFGQPLDASGDPRQRVLDAAHAVTSARAAFAEAKVLAANSEQNLQTLESAAPGTLPGAKILEAEHEVRRTRAAVERLAVDLEIKARQLDAERSMLVGRIKLLEIDLNDANLRLEQADKELARATELLKRAAISAEEFETKQLAQRLAASQRERAQTLLDLYRQALPDQKPAAGDDRTGEKPADPHIGFGDGINEKPNESPPKTYEPQDRKPERS
jgi:hypothetical protein